MFSLSTRRGTRCGAEQMELNTPGTGIWSVRRALAILKWCGLGAHLHTLSQCQYANPEAWLITSVAFTTSFYPYPGQEESYWLTMTVHSIQAVVIICAACIRLQLSANGQFGGGYPPDWYFNEAWDGLIWEVVPAPHVDPFRDVNNNWHPNLF